MTKLKNDFFNKKNAQVLSEKQLTSIVGGSVKLKALSNVSNTMHQGAMNAIRNIRA